MRFEHVLHLLLFSILELIYLGLFEWFYCCDLIMGYQLVAVFRCDIGFTVYFPFNTSIDPSISYGLALKNFVYLGMAICYVVGQFISSWGDAEHVYPFAQMGYLLSKFC